MSDHYLDLAPKTGLTYELYGRILGGVHLANVRGASVAVDWPQWKDISGYFGGVMRLIGPKDDLLSALTLLAPLLDAELLQIKGGLLEVPAGAEPGYAFVRDWSRKQTNPSYLRRMERRAKARGEGFVAPEPASLMHALPMVSQSTQQKFMFGIKRVTPCLPADKTGSSYGLGALIPTF